MFRIPGFLRNLGRVFRDKPIPRAIPLSREEARGKVELELCRLATLSNPVGFGGMTVRHRRPTRVALLIPTAKNIPRAVPTARRPKTRTPMPTRGSRNWTIHGYRRPPLTPQLVA